MPLGAVRHCNNGVCHGVLTVTVPTEAVEETPLGCGLFNRTIFSVPSTWKVAPVSRA